MFWNGRTAREGFSGSGSAGRGEVRGHRSHAIDARTGFAMFFRCCSPMSAKPTPILSLHLPAGVVGDADAARLGQRLEPCGDVDAVAEDVVAIDDDVAEIDADAELDAPILGHVRMALGGGLLHLDGAAHGVDDASEFYQHAVAGGLDDAAAVFGDLRVDQLTAQGLEARERAFLVGAHEPAVAGYVGREDCRQSTLDALGHRPLPHRGAATLLQG